MLALTSGKTIEVLLAGAVTTSQLEVVSSWTDVDPAANPQVVSPAGNNLVTADTAAVTAVAAPTGTVGRAVEHLSVFNADTVAATVTLRLNNGSAVRRLARATLQPGENLTYSGRTGWLTLDAEGAVKSTGQAVLLAGSPVVGGAAFGVLREDAGQLLIADAGLTFSGGQLTISQGGVSSVITQAGAATTINDAATVQLTIAGAPMVTVTASQVQLGNSYLVVTTTGLVIGTVPYTWPGANAAGQLTNDGAGLLSWTAAGAGAAAGSSTWVQVNVGGVLGADAGLVYTGTGHLIADGGSSSVNLNNGGSAATGFGGAGPVFSFSLGSFSGPLGAGVFGDGTQSVALCNSVWAIQSSGPVQMLLLPTADPHLVGGIWNDAGILTVSAG